MAEGLIVEVTHAGLSPNPILLSDVDADSRFDSYRGPGPVYVPVGGTVRLVYSTTVAISFESGAIRRFKELGQITTQMIIGTALEAALGSSPATVDLYLDGTNGDDTNSGTDAAAPVKTWAALKALLRQPILDEVVTIHFSGNYDCNVNGQIDLGDVATVGSGYLSFEGTTTQVYAGTVTAADPLGDRWCFSDGAATFTAADVGRVVEFTTGGIATDPFDSHKRIITEIINPTTVRLSQVSALAGAPSNRPIGLGDAYTVSQFDTLISRTAADPFPAILNTTWPSRGLPGDTGAAYSGSDGLRVSFKNLRILGGISLSHARVDLFETVVHEGTVNWTFAVSLVNCEVCPQNFVAVPLTVSANRLGIWFEICTVIYNTLDDQLALSTSVCALNWQTQALFWRRTQGMLFNIAMMNSYSVFTDSQSVIFQNFAAKNMLAVTFGDCDSVGISSMTFRDAGVDVYGGQMWFNLSVNTRIIDMDGTNTFGRGFYLRVGAQVEISNWSGGGTVEIQNYTVAGIQMQERSSLFMNGGGAGIDIHNNGVGLTARSSDIAVGSGTNVTCRNNAGDGAYLVNCNGSMSGNYNNNGGWGMQVLNVSRIFDDTCAFAGNASGASNVSPSSYFGV